MKRQGHLWDKIVDYDNIVAAHYAARKGKTWQHDIQEVDADLHEHVVALLVQLESGGWRTGTYTSRVICERGKERLIHRLPYWPDRVMHHAIVQQLAPIWRSTMIRQTYASIPGRGIHDAARNVRRQLRDDPQGTT